MLFYLFTWLCYVNSYLEYIFPVVLFITSGRWIGIIILLYCVILSYDMITLLVMRLLWYLYLALLSFLYLWCHLLDSIDNHTLYLFSS